MRVVGHSREDSMRLSLAHTVPSDLRNLQRTSVDRSRIARDAARHDPEAFGGVLFAAIEQDLDPDADADERFAGASYVVAENLDEPERAQIFHRGAGRADAGQNHAVGCNDALGAIGDFGFMAEEFQRALNAGKVAGLVIDDCNHRWNPERRS